MCIVPPSLGEGALLVNVLLQLLQYVRRSSFFLKEEKMCYGNGPSVNGLKGMESKFEKAGSLKIQSGREI